MGSNTYRIVMTRQAKRDIIDIGDYIAYTLLEPETSRKFVKGLRKAIQSLIPFPYKYPLVQDEVLAEEGIHCMPYHNYYIFYEVSDARNIIIIIRVGFNRRKWGDILRQ